MRLLINTAHQRFGGAIQVALSFIYECRQFRDHEFHVLVGPGVAKSLKEKDFPDNFTFDYFDFGPIGLSTTRIINHRLRKVEAEKKPDVIIATSGPTYFHSEAPQIIGFNLPLYIYPESPYIQDMNWFLRLRMSLKKSLHFYFFKRDAYAYVVQTDDVKVRVRKALATDRVYTVTNTYSSIYAKWQKFPDKLPQKPDRIVRLITISAYYLHKNLELIPDIVQELNNRGIYNVQFIVTIEQSSFNRCLGKHFDGQIINVGPVKPEECPSLYNECDAMFLPTLAECFSASYPEAMIMEKPIITTNLGFAKNICGNAALYFKPKSAEDAAGRIIELIQSPSLQKQLIEAGKLELKKFDSSAIRAQKYLNICEGIVQGTL